MQHKQTFHSNRLISPPRGKPEKAMGFSKDAEAGRKGGKQIFLYCPAQTEASSTVPHRGRDLALFSDGVSQGILLF